MNVKTFSERQCSILDMLVVLGNLCGQLLVSQYCLPSYIRDELFILICGIRYLMALV